MPIYTYKCVNDDCQDSGVEFEELRKVSEIDDELICQICGEPVERIKNFSSVRFLGTDFVDTGGK